MSEPPDLRVGCRRVLAILGLVVFLLGGRPADFYGFAAGSLAAFSVYFPRLSQWEDGAPQAPA